MSKSYIPQLNQNAQVSQDIKVLFVFAIWMPQDQL